MNHLAQQTGNNVVIYQQIITQVCVLQFIVWKTDLTNFVGLTQNLGGLQPVNFIKFWFNHLEHPLISTQNHFQSLLNFWDKFKDISIFIMPDNACWGIIVQECKQVIESIRTIYSIQPEACQDPVKNLASLYIQVFKISIIN